MGGVRGILLDSYVLLPSADDDVNGDTVLSPGDDFLLHKLRYSKFPIGISHERGLSSPKECLLQEVAKTCSCTIFCLSLENDISSEIARFWEGNGGTLIHVVSCCREDLRQKENGSDWLKVIVGGGTNPARSLGAAVIYNQDKAWDDHWIFWVGPSFIGAAIAAFYHQFILRARACKALG